MESKPQVLKGKITYGTPDLSAYLASSLAHGLQVGSHVAFKKENRDGPQALNVKLTLGDAPVFGEMSICDYIVSVKNS